MLSLFCGLLLLYAFQQKAEADAAKDLAITLHVEAEANQEKAQTIMSNEMFVEMEQKVKALEADLIECQLIAEQSAEMAKIAEAKLIAEKNKK